MMSIFMTVPADTEIIAYIILTYEKATSSCLNTRKTKAMKAGSLDKSMNTLGSPFDQEITVLGFRFTSKLARSWVTGKFKALA